MQPCFAYCKRNDDGISAAMPCANYDVVVCDYHDSLLINKENRAPYSMLLSSDNRPILNKAA